MNCYQDERFDCLSALVFMKDFYVVHRMQNYCLKVGREGFDAYEQALAYENSVQKSGEWFWEIKILKGSQWFFDYIAIGSAVDFSECIHIKIL